MIIAYLNGNRLHLDEDVGIGITWENFNISDIANRKISRTNSFQVPKEGNEAIFQFASIQNAPSDFAYNAYDFDLIVDGIFIYQNGRAWIVSEEDRYYNMVASVHKSVIDEFKSIALSGLFPDPIDLDTPANLQPLFHTGINGFKIDPLFFAEYPVPGIAPSPWIAYVPDNDFNWYNGVNYLSIFVKTIFEKIETDYSYTFAGDLWSDADFEDFRIPMVFALLLKYNGETNVCVDQIIIHDSYTFFDLFKLILQMFGATFKVSGATITMQKLSDLDVTTPMDWSGKVTKKRKSFSIPEIGQENFIRYQVDDNVNADLFSAKFLCNNLNIDYKKDHETLIAKIMQYRNIVEYYDNISSNDIKCILVPPMLGIDNFLGGGFYKKSGLADILIIKTGTEYLGQPLAIIINYWNEAIPGLFDNEAYSGTITNDAQTKVPVFYDINSNYDFIETFLTDPVFYQAEIMLNILDIIALDPFKAVTIKELGGLFYVNKISNYMISKKNVPCSVELIKIA